MRCQNMTSYLGFDIDADEARFLTPIEGTGKTDDRTGRTALFPFPLIHFLSLGPRKNKQSS